MYCRGTSPSRPPAVISIFALSLVLAAGCTPSTAPGASESVSVSPEAASVESGHSVQLTAVAIDTLGNVNAGRTFTWSSSSPTIAIVSEAGVVTGLAAGAATITATSDGGGTGTSTVTVSASGTSGSPKECDAPKAGWLYCDDYETDRLTRDYFEYDDAGGRFTRASGVGVDGSYGMRVRYPTTQSSAGSLKLAFGPTPSAYIRPVVPSATKHRELYWRLYVRTQEGWVGDGGDKLSRALILATSDWAPAMIAPVWSGYHVPESRHLAIDPTSGTDEAGVLKTTRYGDHANMRWLGAAISVTPVFDESHRGRWYCVEARVRLNDAGQSNGVFELWIDDVKEATRTGLNWIGSYEEYGINAVFVENYWNDRSPVEQERYIDRLVVSTVRVGCGG